MADGDTALELSRQERPDLVLLDLMLPKRDGWEVCRAMRAETTTPIIILTSRAEEADRVIGLELGADDYVVKPFFMRELVARIRATIRRVRLERTAAAPAVMEFDSLRIDVAASVL